MKGDLAVLVADTQCKAVVEAVLARPAAVGIRTVAAVVNVHPGRDPGVVNSGAAVLAQLGHSYTHGLLICDVEGSGWRGEAGALEEKLEQELRQAWGGGAAAIVLQPELEEWLVGARSALGKLGRRDAADVTALWRRRGYLGEGEVKPRRPKEAIEAWLEHVGERRTSAVYREVAAGASLKASCAGRSWPRLVELLRRWFPKST